MIIYPLSRKEKQAARWAAMGLAGVASLGFFLLWAMAFAA